MDDVNRIPESGAVCYNENSLFLVPPNIVIATPTATLKIPMNHFKRFAEWYLEDQG
jgi:hypothetical protein